MMDFWKKIRCSVTRPLKQKVRIARLMLTFCTSLYYWQFLPAQRYAGAVLAVIASVCLSVRLSQAGSV